MLQEAEKPNKNGAIVMEDIVEIPGTNLGLGKKDKCNFLILAALKGTCIVGEGSACVKFLSFGPYFGTHLVSVWKFFKVVVVLHRLKSV